MSLSLLCLFFALSTNSAQPSDSKESVAISKLKEQGACFEQSPFFRFLLEPEEELSKEDLDGFFLTIGNNWKGTKEDLKLLNNLRNLREVAFFHKIFNDDWCASVGQIETLQGLYFSSPGFGLVDRGLRQGGLQIMGCDISKD